MMAVSVAMYMLIRYVKKFDIPPQLLAFAQVSTPLPIYLVLFFKDNSLAIFNPIHWLVMLVQGFIFMYLGNLFAMKGMAAAPNPGYSVMISKVYVVFTAPASVLLFGSELPLKSIAAIALIVIASYFVMVDKKSATQTSNTWIVHTLVAFFCFGGLALSSKYLLNEGLPLLSRMAIPGIFMAIISVVKLRGSHIQKYSSATHYLIVIGLLNGLFNYFMLLGFESAPNVGYVNAANAASTALLTFASWLVFKDELKPIKVVGILGVLAGLLLLFF
jgi:drug/metabolite transporter (DMT)-like permease